MLLVVLSFKINGYSRPDFNHRFPFNDLSVLGSSMLHRKYDYHLYLCGVRILDRKSRFFLELSWIFFNLNLGLVRTLDGCSIVALCGFLTRTLSGG